MKSHLRLFPGAGVLHPVEEVCEATQGRERRRWGQGGTVGAQGDGWWLGTPTGAGDGRSPQPHVPSDGHPTQEPAIAGCPPTPQWLAGTRRCHSTVPFPGPRAPRCLPDTAHGRSRPRGCSDHGPEKQNSLPLAPWATASQSLRGTKGKSHLSALQSVNISLNFVLPI